MSDVDMFNLDIFDDDDLLMNYSDDDYESFDEPAEEDHSIDVDFKQFLKDKIKQELSMWENDDDIYAVYIGSAANNNSSTDPLKMPFLLEIGCGRGFERDWRLAANHDHTSDLIETVYERICL